MQTARLQTVRRASSRTTRSQRGSPVQQRLVTLPLPFLADTPAAEASGLAPRVMPQGMPQAPSLTPIRVIPHKPSQATSHTTHEVMPAHEAMSGVEAMQSALPQAASSSPPASAQREAVRAKQTLMEQLAREVRQLETSRRVPPIGESATAKPVFTSGCTAIDKCLPHRGYEPGTLVEYVQASSACGATYLALSAARAALAGSDRFCVVVDAHQQFYPPAAAAMGIDLKRLVVVRPQSLADRLWAIDQALRSPAVVAVIAEVEQLSDRAARRLQLAAERGGGLGLLIRGLVACRQPSWAEVQWFVRPIPHHRPHASHRGSQAAQRAQSEHATSTALATPIDRQLELQLLRVRGGQAGAQLRVSIAPQDGTLQAIPHSIAAAAMLANQLSQPVHSQHVQAPNSKTQPSGAASYRGGSFRAAETKRTAS